MDIYKIATWICIFGGATVVGAGVGLLVIFLINVWICVAGEVLELFKLKRAFLRWVIAGMPGRKKNKC